MFKIFYFKVYIYRLKINLLFSEYKEGIKIREILHIIFLINI
ncbi:hypothetical protein KL86DYS2_12949 [uncultured Dysgonomonas sp.]|uniref:Uncharacterized protein n=1 Tax=uncultured Dysgonomonas sp. TaxID=206096 RepID=A0A212K3L5_9BACT|nr:hypothetical protein KL86DYS2_12949 [uncultured Dysgonomonas sp.]